MLLPKKRKQKHIKNSKVTKIALATDPKGFFLTSETFE